MQKGIVLANAYDNSQLNCHQNDTLFINVHQKTIVYIPRPINPTSEIPGSNAPYKRQSS